LSFISFRRYYLDQVLEDNKQVFKGKVLDIGGKKDNRRGAFLPPYEQVDEWVFLNNDKQSNPDILVNLPDISLEDNSVDVILCTEVIEYIFDYKKLLFEMRRILKKDGVLLLSFPFIYPLHADDKHDYYRLTEPLIRKELSENFTIEKFNRMGGIPAVIFDLIRGYLSYQTKRTFLVKALHRVLMMTSGLVRVLDKKVCENNYWANTGYCIIARKID
jgi:SAM-dependent methyltransferase